MIFDKTKTQAITRIIAIIAFIPEDKIESKSPKPEIDIGPNIVTRIPPPANNKSHITKINTKIEEFIVKHPS